MKLSKTVYSLIYPESRQVIEELWTSKPLYLYEEAYLRHQDKYHEDFLKSWQQWSSPVVLVDYSSFPHAYPANGSSEALREILAQYASEELKLHREPTLHVFHGEYEGYEAYAKTYGIKIVKHERSNWLASVNLIKAHHYFFLSQPSSVDGNVWPEYDNFLSTLSQMPGVQVLVDLCYVGCVGKDFTINLNHSAIKHFCFSLSKVFGVYYHRIGGVFSKTPVPGLHGNIWFKNLFSLLLGKILMDKFSVFELPKKYHFVQSLGLTHFPTWQASDVIFLINHDSAPEEFQEFQRGPNFRACLTPLMDKIMQGTIK
jgi:hypothetical protein